LIAVEFVRRLSGITQLKKAEFAIQNLTDAQIHPFPDEPASVTSFLLFFEDNLDFFIKIYFFELGATRH
jgi:hypothetical protein